MPLTPTAPALDDSMPEDDWTPLDDSLHEECGVYGVHGVEEAANYVALGLHALQHRGQEAAGI
ncbi:MAG: amidophosphoribosyltransferase, partial [Pseudomonadota bacterium]